MLNICVENFELKILSELKIIQCMIEEAQGAIGNLLYRTGWMGGWMGGWMDGWMVKPG